ncbi:Rv3235 family protein [Corynebacterium heidelbergense]|uniref:Uncharacterized protein n=1 Tax=Corynebacterium heidelbergense TaxID=2055947 RepID=A0A364V5Q8_9CORY|nr:Rv3235 family protein [Corynebacterium heidelbergense]RAV31983.1 hypothetical protein DLJ54_05525 [Corynebacterium heidelbergense]
MTSGTGVLGAERSGDVSMGEDATDRACAALPGFTYLRRPRGGIGRGGMVPAPIHTDCTTAKRSPLPPPAPGHVARLVQVWLEAWDGHRAPASLRKGPFAGEIIERLILQRELAARNAGATPRRQSGASVVSVRVQAPAHRTAAPKVPFCASVRRGSRIRAVAGYLQFYRPRRQQSHAGGLYGPRRAPSGWVMTSVRLI